jgi:hypothetical protein
MHVVVAVVLLAYVAALILVSTHGLREHEPTLAAAQPQHLADDHTHSPNAPAASPVVSEVRPAGMPIGKQTFAAPQAIPDLPQSWVQGTPLPLLMAARDSSPPRTSLS